MGKGAMKKGQGKWVRLRGRRKEVGNQEEYTEESGSRVRVWRVHENGTGREKMEGNQEEEREERGPGVRVWRVHKKSMGRGQREGNQEEETEERGTYIGQGVTSAKKLADFCFGFLCKREKRLRPSSIMMAGGGDIRELSSPRKMVGYKADSRKSWHGMWGLAQPPPPRCTPHWLRAYFNEYHLAPQLHMNLEWKWYSEYIQRESRNI
jgi:hypothetical protein